jgi:DNA gyrase subunit A
VSEVRELGRATQGVTLIALDDGAKLSGLQRIVENDAGEPTAIETSEGDEAPGGQGPISSADDGATE